MRIAVWAQSAGLAFTSLMMLALNASNKLSLDEAGWPSSRPSGLTNETSGRVPLAMAVVRLVTSAMCCLRCEAFAMIDVVYWNGLQMLQ